MARLHSWAAAGGPEERSLPAGALDLRGWEVRTLVDDRCVGTVHDLLLDQAEVLRWLEVALLDGRRVLVPAGQGRADRRGWRVWLPGLAASQLDLLAGYPGDARPLDAPDEDRWLAAYGAALLRESLPDGDDATRAVPLAALPELRGAAGDPHADPRLDPSALYGPECA